MKKHLINIAVCCLVLILASCTKGGGGTGPNNNGSGTLPSYTFGTPQFVANEQAVNTNTTEIREDFTLPQLSAIQANAIVTGVYFTSQGANATVKYAMSKNGSAVGVIATLGVYPTTSYAINADGTTLYAESLTPHALYKFSLNSTATGWQTSNPGLIIANALGTAHCIKIIPGGVVMTSDTLNGALLQVNDNGSTKILASNLGNPAVVDIYNNAYYVAEYAQTGSVVKITSAGTVSQVVVNVDFPLNICFDNNGNFVLQTTQTLSGNDNVRVYTLYTSTGKKIQCLTDQTGAPIQCQLYSQAISGGLDYLYTPLFFDQYNNLYFSQRSLSGYPYGNGIVATGDYPAGSGIYKIAVTKQ